MELVTALFTTVVAAAGDAAGSAGLVDAGATGAEAAAGAGATAGAAAAAGTSAAAAATTAGTAWQALQGTLTAGQMLMQGGAAVGSLLSAGANANQAELSAKAQALNIQRDYLKAVGSARVAFAGAGLTLGNGSEAGVEQGLKSEADFQSQLALATGKAKATGDWLQGITGAAASGGGILKTYGNYEISLANRGLPSQ